MKTNMIAIVIVIALATGGIGFFAGTKYQQSQNSTNRSGNFQGARNGNPQQRAQGFRPVNGDIIASDASSVTVKLQDGSSKIVLLTGTTIINKSSVGLVSDLKTGEKVAVFGTDNPDGSVTAQNVQINPISRDFVGTPSGTPRQ